MRRVDNADQFQEIVKSTQALAESAFGNPDVYLERYIPHARHVEVQVFGFGNGEGVHLFDRDCSIQRRFQKVVEEAPAPDIPDEVRQSMYKTALNLVHSQQYRGAGTVEYIYDMDQASFYFLEMNTRIQVEHPITELITNIDLVRWQIELELGSLMPMAQQDIKATGHAVECRIYAERPEKNFWPSPGQITRLDWSQLGECVRLDTGIREGDTITPFYDPMIAKLIAGGKDRNEAIAHLRQALKGVVIEGPRTNTQFLHDLLCDAEFLDKNITTVFLDDFMERWN
jgi:3-methylcrotonyl-CoA carboxylase alpha subunit